jgi:hypothetical protein
MHAGVPINDYTTFCPPNGASCYFYNRTTANYTVHKAACQARGGYLVAFNSAEEQEAVEAWFVTTTAAMASQSPWIGVEQAGGQWWAAAGCQVFTHILLIMCTDFGCKAAECMYLRSLLARGLKYYPLSPLLLACCSLDALSQLCQ